ncbi:colicin immunity protein [Roseateles sp. PN1]|uniref:colicin immunity protein n=1 Tax=Roseateles sp. PN1 TaxID=3137372 RepID=UPI003139FAAE
MDSARANLVTLPSFFFVLNGSGWMKLAPEAAMHACRGATEAGLVVVRVEGGIWQNPGFEARVDCIWDGIDPPATSSETSINNGNAAAFIGQEALTHSAFVLTCAPLTGYRHRTSTNAV